MQANIIEKHTLMQEVTIKKIKNYKTFFTHPVNPLLNTTCTSDLFANIIVSLLLGISTCNELWRNTIPTENDQRTTKLIKAN